MIKDLTKNNRQAKIINKQQIRTLLSEEHEKMIQEILSRTPQGKTLTEVSQKKERDMSYLYEGSRETTMPTKQDKSLKMTRSNNNINYNYNVPQRSRDSSLSMQNNYPKTTKNSDKFRSHSPALSSSNMKKSFSDSRREDLNKQSNKSFDENVKTLEVLINEIKLRGFEKLKGEIEEKEKIKKQLEIEVENWQKKVNFANSQKKHVGTKNSKIESEIHMYKNLSQRWQRDMYFMNKEMPNLKQEITAMNCEYGERIKETKVLAQIMVEEDRQNQMIKDEIRKMNKRTTEVEKEKDSFRAGIALLKKHVDVLREKIKNEEVKTREFITNVSTLVDKSLG